ncbi:BirA family transcriptional regulator, biotin operon repressor / biotin-[acetyl-CoA-carboxylase] ligase [Flavobacterium fryxellicola]|uniref:Biotin--[acetyl-CoA-carboxylase] ligase n=1 Tax=Flavobacterium fryxellicola TaxID=249352 RepID=A0A167Y538_9FLAO|nr:biotin--[acetyl-CoA-carboxylase] ligase [Flavobacterium fryxellicola]OAB29037.1 biotin--[acetyl-CoA-carboxylase] ligase [Flavobacterium fryxellicola]SHN58993.1 BirA family transcriptional regulator, biotin operon repressor / biotin-[acetyl-CoA-carboxylase] ligase [Flavobacterium fryxellicola]
MKVIKLDAIDSTNAFLKGLSSKQDLENFTVVTAESQTKGKGQMGAVWASEASKNLIMSILVKDFLSDIGQIFNLNIAVSLAVIEVLETMKIPDLSIKWPNDIMSYNKKIGGILIENSIKSDGTIISVVGLGLNVNQTNFENLPKASSLVVISGTALDPEILLTLIGTAIEQKIALWKQFPTVLWDSYTNNLYKIGVPMAFSAQNGTNFMGIIQGVSDSGKLQIMLEDDSVAAFDIKEIQMLY